MQVFHILLAFLLWNGLLAQTTITGSVLDHKGVGVPYANVYIDSIYDGTATAENGVFTFVTSAVGELVLVTSSLGYEEAAKTIVVQGDTVELIFQLRKSSSELASVIVSAGAFEASDKKKGTVLKPLDIVTNPVAGADIYAALATLPGVTPVNDQTGLFVRGGEAAETKTIIDGSLVTKPFFGDVPDIPARGRFDPFLFKGTLFTTGAYSAQYGQALSSVLILETEDLPRRDEYSLGLNMAGASASYTKVWKERTALIGSANYTNLNALFALVPQNREWQTPPNGIGSALAFRHRTNGGGMIKSYLQYQGGNIAIALPATDPSLPKRSFQNHNRNLFWNNSFRTTLKDNWGVLLTASVSHNSDTDQLAEDRFGTMEWLGQSRFTLSRELSAKVFIRTGVEIQLLDFTSYWNEFNSHLDNLYSAVYAEADVRLTKKLAGRLGWRSEYASLVGAVNGMPRLSLTYKAGGNALFSMAYGQFFQTPDFDSFQQSSTLDYEQARHYLANYQWQTEGQIFRIEAYYKDYLQLVRIGEEDTWDNSGLGFSKGIDVFWRDQQSIPGLTYWVSYSLLDAERLYRDYPTMASPTFVSRHTLSVIANYKPTARTRIGCGYTFTSGRPYFNPNNPNFLADRTIDYHNLNFSGSYLTQLFDNFTVIYLSLRNPLRFRQVFGYRYSDDGTMRSAIIPASDWSFFAGISISIRQ